MTGNLVEVKNCVAKNATTAAITMTGNGLLLATEVTGCTAAATAGINVTGAVCFIHGCNIHDNACPGVVGGASATSLFVEGNLITNNTGASSDGINLATDIYVIARNTIYGSGRDGVRSTGARENAFFSFKNNILAKNGVSAAGYGCNFTTAGPPASFNWDGNAYWNNTTGTRNNMDDAGITNVINGVSPYLNTLDVVIASTAGSNNPFTNDAGGDFTLNATAGAGALIRGHGVPASYPNATGTNNRDMGAFQHADPVSSGGSALMF
jgi:hypothetical protein